MSMDYPEYLTLRERSRWLGVLWRIGDIGYYTGLLGAVMAPIGTVVFSAARWLRGESAALSPVQAALLSVLSFVLLAALAIGSARLKAYAHKMGGAWPGDR